MLERRKLRPIGGVGGSNGSTFAHQSLPLAMEAPRILFSRALAPERRGNFADRLA